MGFKQGRISRRVASGRYKDYVIKWLLSYCDRRTSFARNPSPEQLREVHFYCDESFIYRNDHGHYSWYIPGEQHQWGKAQGSAQRWGIFHGMWSFLRTRMKSWNEKWKFSQFPLFSQVFGENFRKFCKLFILFSNSHIICEKIEKFRQIFIKIDQKKLYFSFGEWNIIFHSPKFWCGFFAKKLRLERCKGMWIL